MSKKLTTIYFSWADWHKSTESFKDNWQFYAYMEAMREDWFYPTSMDTTNEDWILDWADWIDWQFVKINIVW